MRTFLTPLLAVLAVLVLIIGINSTYFVYEDEYAVIKRFDKVISTKAEAGLGFKAPFLDSKSSLPKKYIMYDLNPSEVLTLDKKSMIADTYAVWKISEPLKFIQNAGNINELESRLDAAIYGSLKTIIGSINQVDIIESRTDNSLNAMILENAKASIANYGATLLDVQIKRFDLPESNKMSVYERMISERNQIAATYTAEGEEEANMIRNTADKEKEIIISKAEATSAELVADGESEYMRILANAYNSPERADFYKFLRTLDTLKVSMSGDKTLLLPSDSILTQTLVGGTADIPEDILLALESERASGGGSGSGSDGVSGTGNGSGADNVNDMVNESSENSGDGAANTNLSVYQTTPAANSPRNPSIESITGNTEPVRVRFYYNNSENAETGSREYYSYNTRDIGAENFYEDFMAIMYSYTDINMEDIWYEGRRLCVNLNAREAHSFDIGSTGGAIRSSVLYLTLESLPNVDEIKVYVDGEEDVYGDHFGFSGVYTVGSRFGED
ncbi:MAG: protease modulator HflC [Clostridiales bacterium]|jgi:membrane protease subunit HflC|nr:protease modulator HflC [Clostridiales bacterium]